LQLHESARPRALSLAADAALVLMTLGALMAAFVGVLLMIPNPRGAQ
jgi:hypothetical protein